MKIKRISIFCLSSLLLSCSGSKYDKTDLGVIVNIPQTSVNGVKRVRLEVMDEKVIHVSATPERNFSTDESLIIIPSKGETPFTISETDSTVSVETSQVRATVAYATGQVTFYNAEGNLILAEEADGRSFKPIEVEGTKGYTVRQVFQSLDKQEGYYGLGQHQSDEFNYKGKNEELFQYNTKVSIPFIVSTNNYGLLWDSYSLCRWGNPEDYKQLGEVFKLYDKDGREGALTGTYTPESKDEQVLVRREDSIYFEHLDRAKHLSKVVNLPENFNFGGSKVVYEGEIEPSVSGEYKFILYYAGYQTVTIDGKEVVPERWRTAWNPNSYKFSVNLEAGKRVPIRIDWVPDGGISYCGLRAYAPRPEDEQLKMSWWGEMQSQEDYYFIYGDNIDDVIHGYRTITGKAPIMPKWVMGFWQSREKYNTQEEILDALAGFRKRNIPIDNIVLDWLHWREDSWGSHEFDKDRFPDPKAMVDSIHNMHGRIMVSVWPKFYTTTEHYKEFDKKGWMYQQAIKDSILDWVGPGYLGSFYDAYDPEARKLFWSQVKDHYYPLGIDAWWMDASEPNIRDCTDMQYRKELCGPTALGPSTKYFNAYAYENAEAIYDGQRSTEPNKRVFLLTRSGFAGLQRYSTATWSGDIGSCWEDFKSQISAGLNFSISGVPFWSMDIGGFSVQNRYVDGVRLYEKTGRENEDCKEWRELNTRWYQFGAFAPLYRAHGQWPLREVYNLAPESHPAYKSIVYYTKLRYDLMPYIYSLAAMTHFDDYTIMRPMVMDFTVDKNVRSISDQYMFGPYLLVAPVYEYGARSRQVYLPGNSVWYDFYTGKEVPGGYQVVDAPYERIPLFVRSGSILPVGPDMQWSDEKQADTITLFVYEGADGHFTLYEDEGTNYNYEKGKYAKIELSYNDETSVLTIDKRQGEFDGMLTNRTFNIVKVAKDHPVPYNKTIQGVTVNYNGNKKEVHI
jgi:alpha-D-xyloside xylohydrolase